MSRSYRARRRLTDPRDVAYLRALGATEKLLSMEKTAIAYETIAAIIDHISPLQQI